MRIKKQAASACIIAGLAVVVGWATIPGAACARQGSSANSTAATAQSQNSNQSNSASSSSSTADQDPLAAAARKAKAQKNQNAKPAKVFTNDNLPSTGVSTVGSSSPADASGDASTSSAAAASAGQGEKYWRDKFASLNKKVDQDQEELGIMQRELGQLNLQNYSDPNVAMQQGYSRSDIDKKTTDIDAKQKQIDADKQAISDAEDDLRKSGGDPGWGR